MEALKSLNLCKVYDGVVEAIKNVNVYVNKGEFYTLLGPNGAGKTTFLRILSTQLLPTSGECYVLGHNVVEDSSEVCKHIAVVPQDIAAYASYTPWDYAYYFARLRGMSKEEAKKNAEKALQIVKLWNIRKRKCSAISGGERRRALIASALASNADVLLLDEPTSGLDAVAKRSVLSSLRALTKEGKTVLMTTHDMEETEIVSDRLGIINKGQIIAEGSPEEIKSLMKKRYRVVVNGDINSLVKHDNSFTKLGDKCIFYVFDEDEASEIMRKALKNGLRANVSPITLEDAFVKLVGEGYEGEN